MAYSNPLPGLFSRLMRRDFKRSDKAGRKCPKHVKDHCNLCGVSTATYIKEICRGCGKVEYCSTYCLVEDMLDHGRDCKLTYPKIKPEINWQPLVSRFNARESRTPPQDNTENRPRKSTSVQFMFIQNEPPEKPLFKRSDTVRPLPSLDCENLPSIIEEPELEDPVKPKNYLISRQNTDPQSGFIFDTPETTRKRYSFQRNSN